MHIVINTTPEEQEQVFEAIKELIGKTVSVSEIAKKADLNPNRVRYIIADLESAGKIRRIPTKAFNKHYIRYRYEIRED